MRRVRLGGWGGDRWRETQKGANRTSLGKIRVARSQLVCPRRRPGKNEALVEFALGDLPNKLFVSRYAVEMPKKAEMEAFLRQLGKEVAS